MSDTSDRRDINARPESTRKVHEVKISPFWSHMDDFGHVNNAVYFTYCEQARITWFETLGLADGLHGKLKEGPVLVNASCSYLRPVMYPADLLVSLYVGTAGRSSFMAWYEITNGTQLCTTGSSKIVWIDYTAGKSVALPEGISSLIP